MTVLFVCVHNAGRSQMAEGFFNRLAKGRARAISAGTDPADTIDPTVAGAMREVGIDISDQRPRALIPEMIEQADKVLELLEEIP